MTSQNSSPDNGFNTLKNAFDKFENSSKGEMTMTKKNDNSNVMFWGKIAVAAAGGYMLWRNRFKVQRLLEANGISTPWMKSTVSDAVQSGAAKIAGSVEHEVKTLTHSNTLSNLSKDAHKAVI